MDYKKQIIATLDELEKLTGAGSTVELRKTAEGLRTPYELFIHSQTLREVLAGLAPEPLDTSFTVATPQGNKKFKTLVEFTDYAEKHFAPKKTSYSIGAKVN